MIAYVVTDTLENYRKSSSWLNVKHVLEECSGDVCLILHYKQVCPALLAELRPWAVCHSGGSALYGDYDVLQTADYRRLVTGYEAAQIGFCGGHQLIAKFLGSTIGPMRKLRPGEPDLAGYLPGQFKEWGVYPVRVLRPDPLFEGLGKTIRVQEYHAWEVRKLGGKLPLLASTPGCKVQAFVHADRPVYGVQFHPEAASDNYPDGFAVLKNFFRLAKDHWGVQIPW